MNTNISATPAAIATLDAVFTAEPTLEPVATSTVAPIEETGSTIPARPATIPEAFKLIGEGWGSIFVVIGIMIVVVLLLNKVFSRKKK